VKFFIHLPVSLQRTNVSTPPRSNSASSNSFPFHLLIIFRPLSDYSFPRTDQKTPHPQNTPPNIVQSSSSAPLSPISSTPLNLIHQFPDHTGRLDKFITRPVRYIFLPQSATICIFVCGGGGGVGRERGSKALEKGSSASR
jgi:hypothetical protein